MKVLLIEDNPDAAELVRLLLEPHLEFELKWCNCLSDGLRCLAENKFDAALLDLALPDAYGLQTFTALHLEAPALPVIILTGVSDEELTKELLQRGAQDYLLKDRLNCDSLLRSLRYAVLRKKSDELEAHARLTHQRNEFRAALAHDLKMPLDGAKKLLALLIDGLCGGFTPKQLEPLRLLQENNQRLLTMVNSLLEVYRYETGEESLHIKELDLASTIADAIASTVSLQTKDCLEVRVNIPDGLTTITADYRAICRLLSNIFDNAAKFTPSGGLIEISAERSTTTVSIRIKDTGLGISTEDQNRLFDRWWQGESGKKYVASTGLGLYLCRLIVEAHHGTIKCESTIGTGTTFTIALPIRSTSTAIKMVSQHQSEHDK